MSHFVKIQDVRFILLAISRSPLKIFASNFVWR